MERIAGRKIKIYAHSITIKGENGKTCGVVRDIQKFSDIPTRDNMEFFRILRSAGVWGDLEFMEGVVFKNGEMFYLHNLSPMKFCEEYADFLAAFPNEKKRYNERKAAAENMAKHCTVIPCYFC